MIIRTLLIEDEPPAALRLKKMIASLRPHWTIVESIDSVEDAVEWLEKNETPNLVFMDIQLADGLSFEIFKKTTLECPIIFTTAFNDHMLEAFKVNSVDYLLKPIEDEQLEAAIQKFEKTRIAPIDLGMITQLLLEKGKSAHKDRKRFLVKTAGRLSFIPIEDIAYFFSDDGNTFITTKPGERFLVEHTIEEIEQEISRDHFFRINRKMIIHIDAIARIEPHFNNRFMIETLPSFDEEIVVSRLRVAEFKDWLDQ